MRRTAKRRVRIQGTYFNRGNSWRQKCKAEIHHRVEKHRIAGSGWKPGPPDVHDHYFSVQSRTMKALPASVDLRSKYPPVYDQGEIGSCIAGAIAGAIKFERRKARQETMSACYKAALKYQAIEYRRVMPILSQMKVCLAEGNPFVFGFSVYARLYDGNGDAR